MTSGSKYEQAVLMITKEQEKIVGKDLAIQMTTLVHNLRVKDDKVTISGDPKAVLKELIEQYSSLFGKASIEVSKQAITKLGHDLNDTEFTEYLK